jgi:hypothetical protein
MKKFSLDNILKISRIENEFELEQASSLYNKLRPLLKDDPSLKSLRVHLANLIEEYEAEFWSNESNVNEEQIRSSDYAENLIQYQDHFIQRRKQLIKKSLNDKDLIQNDLAKILGHRKNYMSELINGVRPLSKSDIVIINRLLNIDFNDLMIPIIEESEALRIRQAIKKMNKPQLHLNEEDLNIELA